ncbi:MAG: branched-chain amino acid ABC transporter permease [Rhizobiales bacterium PAR1]|nr:MAG: branched-chain amino acid ABC transporter permease [Rhizobiales bacterium PAR1]
MRSSLIMAALVVLALAAPFAVYPVLLMTILCFALFAASFNLLLGYVGLLSFGHAMFFGGGAYITGYLVRDLKWPMELGLVGAVVVALIAGLFLGTIAIRRQGIYFAMITLAFSQMIYFIFLQAPFTGGENGLQGIPRTPLLGILPVETAFSFYYAVLVAVGLGLLLIYRIVYSPFGELLRAIRDNAVRVDSLGFDVNRHKILAFTLSAALAAFAGGLKALVFQFAPLADVSWTVSGEVILMTLLGGLGTFSGPLFGAAIIILLNDTLSSAGEWALVLQGVIFLIVLVFFRTGFVGLLSRTKIIKLV